MIPPKYTLPSEGVTFVFVCKIMFILIYYDQFMQHRWSCLIWLALSYNFISYFFR